MLSLFVFFFGCIFGSFYACTIYRYVQAEKCDQPFSFFASFMGNRSACPSCNKTLTSWQLVPILSYIFLRGKCAFCHASISPFYACIELVTGLACLALFWHFGSSLEFALYFLIFSVLLVASCIDFCVYILPDACTLGALFVLVPLGLYVKIFSWQHALYGALFAGGLLGTLYLYFLYVRKKEALGLGDVKYAFFLGALIGPYDVSLFFALSASLGILAMLLQRLFYGKDYALWQRALPFGPFLSLGALIVLVIREAFV